MNMPVEFPGIRASVVDGRGWERALAIFSIVPIDTVPYNGQAFFRIARGMMSKRSIEKLKVCPGRSLTDDISLCPFARCGTSVPCVVVSLPACSTSTVIEPERLPCLTAPASSWMNCPRSWAAPASALAAVSWGWRTIRRSSTWR